MVPITLRIHQKPPQTDRDGVSQAQTRCLFCLLATQYTLMDYNRLHLEQELGMNMNIINKQYAIGCNSEEVEAQFILLLTDIKA